MYRVELTTNTTYQNITRFADWQEDDKYFIFYWTDKTYIIIKKEFIITIQKER